MARFTLFLIVWRPLACLAWLVIVTAFSPPSSLPIHRSVPLPITLSHHRGALLPLPLSTITVTQRTALWATIPTSTPATFSRREVLTTAAAAATAGRMPRTAAAADPLSTSPWDAVRHELYDPDGGVAYLQSCLEQRNFAAVLTFTKEYDQILRKSAMGRAKKTLHDPTAKEQATAAGNAVTFDLIGMNRNARPGQENYEQAVKYLQELKQDAEALLALEGK